MKHLFAIVAIFSLSAMIAVILAIAVETDPLSVGIATVGMGVIGSGAYSVWASQKPKEEPDKPNRDEEFRSHLISGRDLPPEEYTLIWDDRAFGFQMSTSTRKINWQVITPGKGNPNLWVETAPLFCLWTVVTGFGLSAMFLSFAYLVHTYSDSLPKEIAPIWFTILMFLSCISPITPPFFDWIVVGAEKAHWKNKPRLEYDPETGELRFPADKKEYQTRSGTRPIVAYTTVYTPPFGTSFRTQLYVLVQKPDGVWRRHALAMAKTEKIAKEATEQLSQVMGCEVYRRRMSKAEYIRRGRAQRDLFP